MLALSSVCCFPVLAAEKDDEKIGAMTISISSDYSVGDEVDEDDFNVSCSTEGVSYDGFDLDYGTATKDGGESWSKYDTPILTIYLTAEDGYYFDKKSKGSFKLEGTEAEFISADRSSDKYEMELQVRLESLNGSVGNVSDLYWTDYSIARWTKGYKNKKYSVKLYRNNSLVTTVETSNTSFDFANYMNRVGDYHFEVRGMATDSKRADYIESETVYINDLTVAKLVNKTVDNSKTYTDSVNESKTNTNSGGPGQTQTVKEPVKGWIKDAKGWWYKYSDGAWPVSQWEFINNKWYYFDETGYMVTGWRFVNNKWYYMDYSGAMLTGWQYINGQWYYLHNVNGDMLTDWQFINGQWYYLAQSGERLTGYHTINDKNYYFDNNGVWRQ